MSLAALGFLAAAVAARLIAGRASLRVQEVLFPLAVSLVGLAVWQAACEVTGTQVFPTPKATLLAFGELIESQRLWGDVIASLYRVTWGFFLAALVVLFRVLLSLSQLSV